MTLCQQFEHALTSLVVDQPECLTAILSGGFGRDRQNAELLQRVADAL